LGGGSTPRQVGRGFGWGEAGSLKRKNNKKWEVDKKSVKSNKKTVGKKRGLKTPWGNQFQMSRGAETGEPLSTFFWERVEG